MKISSRSVGRPFSRKAYISLLYAHTLEDVCDSADFLQKLIVGKLDMGAGLIGLPNDGSLR
jgi:hypothetical protein